MSAVKRVYTRSRIMFDHEGFRQVVIVTYVTRNLGGDPNVIRAEAITAGGALVALTLDNEGAGVTWHQLATATAAEMVEAEDFASWFAQVADISA